MKRKESREEKLVRFYRLCRSHCCASPRTESSKIKAKTFAEDVGLKYKDITVLLAEAKDCYNKNQAELLADQSRTLDEQHKKELKEKEELKAKEELVKEKGILLLTVFASIYKKKDDTYLEVYVRPDKSVYSISNDGTLTEGSPEITVHKSSVSMMTYHPSKAVYTGATVGGITTGGVHYTEAGYSVDRQKTGNGYISINHGDKSFCIDLVTVTEYTLKLFKRDSAYHRLVDKRQIQCVKDTEQSEFYANAALSGKLDHATTMTALSMGADERCIDYAKCTDIANLLERIVNAQFPDSDEEVYASADKIAKNAQTLDEIKQAIFLFRNINGYHDSRKRADELQKKYDDLIQKEKEEKIRKKESRKGLFGLFGRKS